MSIATGDVATWAGVAVTFGVSVAALIVSIRSLKHARRSADAAEDSASSSRRSADAAERQAIAAEKALPPPPPPVAWEIEHVSKHRYAMYNTGAETATGVEIDTERAGCIVRDAEKKATVASNSFVTFLMVPSFGNPAPRELWVTWDGQDEPVPVPVPPQ